MPGVAKLVSPVRVLSVIHPFRPLFSGEGEWWVRLVPFLRARGVEVEILTSSSEGGGSPVIPEIVEGIPVHRVRLPPAPPSYWSCLRRIGGTMMALIRRRSRFDVVLFHGPNLDTVYPTCLVGRLFGWKTVYKMTLFRSDDLLSIRQSGRFGRLRLAALHFADGFISMSKVLVGRFADRTLVRGKLLLAPQGVDIGKFRPADAARKRAVRGQLGLSDGARVVLFCGAVVHRKGVDILLEAWCQIRAHLPDGVLLLVGPNHHDGLMEEPEYRSFSEAVERRTRESDLAGSVRLLGYQRETDRFYAAADVFAFPSRSEGWPSVLMEAMASGLPCVVSPLDGASAEHFRDGEEGVIAKSEDPSEYAGHILRLLTDLDLARRIGARARTRAEAGYGSERVADRYAAFLRGLVQTPPAAP